MDRIIFHIDVNSAYLSWSALDLLSQGSSKDLRKIPAIIGGDMEKRHGVVLAKSIPAKKYGIVTGEPIVNAMRKCPTLTIVPPNHHLYHEKSRSLMELLSGFTSEIEQVSVDECYMDYTSIRHLYASPLDAASLIKDSVHSSLGFTVNIGISDKKILAKMASDFEKPDKIHTLYSYEIREKMWPLPVSSLFMCGKSSVESLRKLEIETIGQLAAADKNILSAHLKSHGILLWEYANGIDNTPVISVPAENKGIGNSTTLPKDVSCKEEAYRVLLSLSESVASRLRKAKQFAGMVSVEIKYSSFRSVSHQTMLYTPSDTTGIIHETACHLFDELWNGSPIRLLGVRTSKLSSSLEPTQLNLFDLPSSGSNKASNQKLTALDKALDDIRNKFGENAVMRGSLLSANNSQQSSPAALVLKKKEPANKPTQ